MMFATLITLSTFVKITLTIQSDVTTKPMTIYPHGVCDTPFTLVKDTTRDKLKKISNLPPLSLDKKTFR